MTPKQIISILQSQVEVAEQENNGLRATRDDLAKALQGLKTVVEIVVARGDGTQYANIETRSGLFVRVADVLAKADAALALAAQSGINPKS